MVRSSSFVTRHLGQLSILPSVLSEGQSQCCFGWEANQVRDFVMYVYWPKNMSWAPRLHSSVAFLTFFRVADADLLKKLKGDYIKSMDDSALKSVNALLESFAADLRECFPFLHSAVGTLSVSINLTGINVYSAIHPTGALLWTVGWTCKKLWWGAGMVICLERGFPYGPADATATPSSHASLKSRLV